MTLRNLLLLAASLSALSTSLHAQTAPADDAISEVIVRGNPLRHSVDETATPVAKLTGEDLVHRRQATLGETLQGLPGVNADTFGAGAARPVIRGQTAPRVKVLADSSELMDASAVSPDHAITTEPLLLKEIEVFRGPSALIYGGGAIAGAVNLVDSKIPTEVPVRGVEGVAELRGGTNGAERAGVFGVTVGGAGFALHAEGVRRTSDDYEVSGWDEDHVHGTYNDTSTISFGGSWIGSRGFLGAAYTLQNSRYGLPGHAHEYEDCHPHGATLHCGGHGEEEDGHDHGDGDEHGEEEVPFVLLKSKRFDLRGEMRDPLPGIERVRLRAGLTDYRHQEIEDGAAATTFVNDGHDVRLEVEHAPLAGWSGVVGLQTSSSDFSALGEEAFLPASRTRSTGLFVFEEMNWNAWHLEVAARKDWQEIDGADITAIEHEPFGRARRDPVGDDRQGARRHRLFDIGVFVRRPRASGLQQMVQAGQHHDRGVLIGAQRGGDGGEVFGRRDLHVAVAVDRQHRNSHLPPGRRGIERHEIETPGRDRILGQARAFRRIQNAVRLGLKGQGLDPAPGLIGRRGGQHRRADRVVERLAARDIGRRRAIGARRGGGLLAKQMIAAHPGAGDADHKGDGRIGGGHHGRDDAAL